MLRGLFSILGFLFIAPIIAQNTITGTIKDKSNQEVLVGATVQVLNTYKATATNINGQFTLQNVEANSALVVSFIGYENDTVIMNGQKDLSILLSPKNYQTDAVLIQSVRSIQSDGAASTQVSKEEIAENNLGADIPYLLQQSPSVVSTSDAGAGIGYTGIRIRGSDATRINVTVNGIPINDSESHGVFWVNMPDLASSLESIEIQRGLGTSTNGAAAFGASLNLETNLRKEKAYAEINNSFGSFNTRKNTFMAGTGVINNRFSFDSRWSSLSSDGYIDRARADLNSYYLAGSYYGEKTLIKAIHFAGKEITYQSWYGTPESKVNGDKKALEEHIANNYYPDDIAENLRKSDRRYNHYLYNNQVDNYGQDHYQLHFSHQFSKKITANLALHYTKGEGYFEEFKRGESLNAYGLKDVYTNNDTIQTTDLIRRRWLDNDFYGATYSILWEANKSLSFNIGGAANKYEGDHFGEIIWAEYASNSFPGDHYYFNKGEKTDANSYIKANWIINNQFSATIDLQYRQINYETAGTDNDQRQIKVKQDYHFFNPKLGLNYQIDDQQQVSILIGQGSREPNRADLVDRDSTASKAETMQNVELSYSVSGKKYLASLNFYAMEYDKQLINTGALNDVGSPIRQNVKDSYRRGVELSLSYAFNKWIKYHANATYSQNKIKSFTEIVYDYTNGLEEVKRNKGLTDIAFSPNIIANGELVINPNKKLEIGIQTRYVSEQFLDNTSNKNRMLDAYLVNDLRAEYRFSFGKIKELRIMVRINNLFAEEYSSNGYTYSYIYGTEITENFLYPQALRNYLIGLNLKF